MQMIAAGCATSRAARVRALSTALRRRPQAAPNAQKLHTHIIRERRERGAPRLHESAAGRGVRTMRREHPSISDPLPRRLREAGEVLGRRAASSDSLTPWRDERPRSKRSHPGS